jgi:small nuclear ribonucleoprotein B and B'
MSMARGSRMLRYINYRMRITVQDSRIIVGTFMAFDRHMNIVLGDAEEFRKIKSKKTSGISEEKEEKRTLGLIILRGDSVVSMTIEGPPPPENDGKMMPGGPGTARAAGRGLPVAPSAGGAAAGAVMGLAGPVRGVGGPGMSMMQPGVHVAAMQAPSGMGMPPGMMPPGMGAPPRGPPMGMGMLPPGMGPPGGMMMPPGMGAMPPRGAMPMPPGMGQMPPGMPMMPPGMPPRGPPGPPPRG